VRIDNSSMSSESINPYSGRGWLVRGEHTHKKKREEGCALRLAFAWKGDTPACIGRMDRRTKKSVVVKVLLSYKAKNAHREQRGSPTVEGYLGRE